MDSELYSFYLLAYELEHDGSNARSILHDAVSRAHTVRSGCQRFLAVTYGIADGRAGATPSGRKRLAQRVINVLELFSGVPTTDSVEVVPEMPPLDEIVPESLPTEFSSAA